MAAPQPAVATSPRHLLLPLLVALASLDVAMTPLTSLPLPRSPSFPWFSPARPPEHCCRHCSPLP